MPSDSVASSPSSQVPFHFADRLAERTRALRAPVCVGLDPRFESLPAALRRESPGGWSAADFADAPAGADRALVDALLSVAPRDPRAGRALAYAKFCQGIVDAVADLVPAVKPQAAFFEQLGPWGMVALGAVVEHSRRRGLLVIVDGKRNDIGSTAAAYAEGFLGPGDASPWGGDALTVSPYLGDDGLEPFVSACVKRGAGIFVLVKTSNPGGKLFQDLSLEGETLYRRVGAFVEVQSRVTLGDCGYGAVGAVVGATHPDQQNELRAAMPSTWFLVPGYGSQGASAKDVAGSFDARGLGAIVNNSRGVIFAYEKGKYREKFGEARWQDAAAQATRDMLDELRADTPAGKL